ncbi:MAG TPA: hypothetical protein VJ276_20380, partial [Thermoanaerobaculia bacterium]|nr:hypothetical protein [Thermoanaerobaculia bacterium]
EAIIARSIGTQFGPRGLFDGTNFAFTWMEDASVYFNRVTPDGQSLDGGGIRLGAGYTPQIAFNGQQYAVAFVQINGSQSVVARVGRDGKLLDLAPIIVPPVAALATDGRDFLLLTLQTAQPARIRPVILTAQGELLPQPVIADIPFDSSNPGVAWTDSHYAVVYTQAVESFCFKCNQKFEMHTVLLDRTGREVSPIRTILAAQGFPSAFQLTRVASGGGSTIAVFGGATGAHVVRIGEDGVPTITASLQDSFYPTDAIWTGSDFVVSSLTLQPALRIAADGSLLQTFPIGPPDAGAPTLVAGAPRLTIVYDRPVRVEGAGTIRRAFFDFVQERRRRAR